MPVGKNSLARAAKQVSDAKNKETATQATIEKSKETVAPTAPEKKKPTAPKKPKTKPQAIPLEVLSEKVPADETSRPAISPVSDVTVTPDHLPAIDVNDALSTEAAPTNFKKYALGDDLPYYLL